MRLSTWLCLPTRCLRPKRLRRPTGPPASHPRLEALEARDNPSGGLLDPTFGSGGFALNTTTTAFADVLVQADGKIVAGGWGSNLTGGRRSTYQDFAIARYNPNGILDAAFGSGGLAAVDFNRSSDQVRAVAFLPGSGGKILAAGRSDGNFAVVRLNPNGTLDNTFGGGKKPTGKVTIDLGGWDTAHSMAVLPDGKILLAGSTAPNASQSNGQLALVRFNANGTLDTSFGSGGKVVSIGVRANGSSQLMHVVNVSLDGIGRAVVSAKAASAPGEDDDFLVARFTPSGSLDGTFGASGVVITDVGGGTYDIPYALGLQADGKIVVAGSSEQFAAVARYNPDGTLDGTFGQGGITTASVLSAPSSAEPMDLAVQPDGKILLGGQAWDEQTTWQNFLMRFNADGSLDTSYGSAGTGWVVAGFGPTLNALVSAMALQADGRVILVGEQQSPTTYTNYGVLARYLPSGPQVTSFTASPSPAPSGADVTLAASVTAGNPGSLGAVAQVAFYADSNGDGVLDLTTDALLGNASYDPTISRWTLTISSTGWGAGSYRLFARARDGYGAWGDPFAITFEVL